MASKEDLNLLDLDLDLNQDLVEIESQPLDLSRYLNAVRDAGAGAISTFAGTTRDTFQGHRVLKLEYEAYVPMALRQMRSIVRAARSRWQLVSVAAAHRIGTVPVSEESVFIAVSSVHRSDAIHACHFIIDEIKASVPIWKKEVYSDGQVWKENSEFFALDSHQPQLRKPCRGRERPTDNSNGHGSSDYVAQEAVHAVSEHPHVVHKSCCGREL